MIPLRSHAQAPISTFLLLSFSFYTLPVSSVRARVRSVQRERFKEVTQNKSGTSFVPVFRSGVRGFQKKLSGYAAVQIFFRTGTESTINCVRKNGFCLWAKAVTSELSLILQVAHYIKERLYIDRWTILGSRKQPMQKRDSPSYRINLENVPHGGSVSS